MSRAGKEAPLEADALAEARAVALRFLRQRPRSRWEVERRLEKAQVDADLAVRVMERLEEEGALDDALFARAWVQGKAGQAGERLVEKQLRQRGVAREVVEAALAAEMPRETKLEAARELIAKRGRGDWRKDPAARRKAWNLLARRGFSEDVIAEAMRGEE